MASCPSAFVQQLFIVGGGLAVTANNQSTACLGLHARFVWSSSSAVVTQQGGPCFLITPTHLQGNGNLRVVLENRYCECLEVATEERQANMLACIRASVLCFMELQLYENKTPQDWKKSKTDSSGSSHAPPISSVRCADAWTKIHPSYDEGGKTKILPFLAPPALFHQRLTWEERSDSCLQNPSNAHQCAGVCPRKAQRKGRTRSRFSDAQMRPEVEQPSFTGLHETDSQTAKFNRAPSAHHYVLHPFKVQHQLAPVQKKKKEKKTSLVKKLHLFLALQEGSWSTAEPTTFRFSGDFWRKNNNSPQIHLPLRTTGTPT